MATLFTLAAPMSDSIHSILNGKVFTIHQNKKNNHLTFTDVATQEEVLESTSMTDKIDLGTKVLVKTSSGTEFALLKVEYLIPTSDSEKIVNQIVEEFYHNVDIEPSESEHIFRHIDYGDGYDGTVYHFNHPVSYEEFVAFCKASNLNMANEIDVDIPWYLNYPLIVKGAMRNGQRIGYDEKHINNKQPSMIWTYLVVHPYTD